MIKFSFIIPVYNCEKYIESCIECLMEIGRKDVEIILVNDGSTDNSKSILKKCSDENEKIKVIHQCNKGVSVARNVGMENACGEYVIFLDADDTVDSKSMERLLECIDKHACIDMAIYGLTFDYYYHGKMYRRDKLKPPLTGVKDRIEWINNLVSLYETNSLSPLWNKVIRKSILLDNNLRLEEDMIIYEDLEFSLRCMAHCEKTLFFQDCIYHYRQSEDEGNAGRRLKKIEHIPELIKKIDASLQILLAKDKVIDIEVVRKTILTKLYMVLAREKNNVSNIREIRIVCKDYENWVNKEQVVISESDVYSKIMLERKLKLIIVRRIYFKFRHWIAVRVKNMVLYQKTAKRY